MKRESFRKGLRDGVPIGLGYFAVSFTFGMMAVADGLSIWQAVLISLTNVTSAGQFAGLEIMVGNGADPADHQSSLLSDVIFPGAEIQAGRITGAPLYCSIWRDR